MSSPDLGFSVMERVVLVMMFLAFVLGLCAFAGVIALWVWA
jgi:hypothetical protein